MVYINSSSSLVDLGLGLLGLDITFYFKRVIDSINQFFIIQEPHYVGEGLEIAINHKFMMHFNSPNFCLIAVKFNYGLILFAFSLSSYSLKEKDKQYIYSLFNIIMTISRNLLLLSNSTMNIKTGYFSSIPIVC